jgi:hypothetical protein
MQEEISRENELTAKRSFFYFSDTDIFDRMMNRIDGKFFF